MQDHTSDLQNLQLRLIVQQDKISEISNKILEQENLLQTDQQKNENLRFAQIKESNKKLNAFLPIFLENIRQVYGDLQNVASKTTELTLSDHMLLQKSENLLSTLEELTESVASLTDIHVNINNYSELVDLPKETIFFTVLKERMKVLLEENKLTNLGMVQKQPILGTSWRVESCQVIA